MRRYKLASQMTAEANAALEKANAEATEAAAAATAVADMDLARQKAAHAAAAAEAGPGRYCPPRHPPHFDREKERESRFPCIRRHQAFSLASARILNPRFLSYMASHDVASNIW